MTAAVLVADVSALLLSRRLQLVTAESCTGGLLAAAITERPGSSEVFERGFVTYANAAKQETLGVAPALLQAHGAVSAEVAQAMAIGALNASPADIAVSVTGIAGPGGGTAEKTVGLVFIAVGDRTNIAVRHYQFAGPRAAIRQSAVLAALDDLRSFLQPTRVA